MSRPGLRCRTSPGPLGRHPSLERLAGRQADVAAHLTPRHCRMLCQRPRKGAVKGFRRDLRGVWRRGILAGKG